MLNDNSLFCSRVHLQCNFSPPTQCLHRCGRAVEMWCHMGISSLQGIAKRIGASSHTGCICTALCHTRLFPWHPQTVSLSRLTETEKKRNPHRSKACKGRYAASRPLPIDFCNPLQLTETLDCVIHVTHRVGLSLTFPNSFANTFRSSTVAVFMDHSLVKFLVRAEDRSILSICMLSFSSAAAQRSGMRPPLNRKLHPSAPVMASPGMGKRAGNNANNHPPKSFKHAAILYNPAQATAPCGGCVFVTNLCFHVFCVDFLWEVLLLKNLSS